MEKVRNTFEIICDKAVNIMILGIAGVLAFWAARYTYFYPADYSKEHAVIAPDSLFKNLLVFAAVLLCLYGLGALVLRGSEEQQRRRVLVFAVLDVCIVGILLSVYISQTHLYPYWDQAQVYYDALNFKTGDYSDILGYLVMYPQQYGLIFLYEIMFLVGSDNYITIQYFNAVFVLLAIFFGYRLTDELFHNQTINFYSLLGLTFFLPLHIYTNFVYGDIASTACVIVGLWAVLRWHKHSGFRYVILAMTFFTLAYLFRKNILIVLVAVLLVMLIDAFRHMNWKAAVLGVLLLLVPMAVMTGVKWSYEMRSGYEIGEGIPAVAWVAMGMQESYTGCGVFNGYTESIFHGEGGGDSAVTAQIVKEYIRDRMGEFSKDQGMMIDFYKAKVQCQWIEPTFSSLIMTSQYLDRSTDFAVRVYSEPVAGKLISFMNYYNFMIYAGGVLYALWALYRRDSIVKSAALVAVIGGFLFSILWEAKGRYVMPYVILLIPYMCGGIYMLQINLKKWMNKAIVSCNLRK